MENFRPKNPYEIVKQLFSYLRRTHANPSFPYKLYYSGPALYHRVGPQITQSSPTIIRGNKSSLNHFSS